MSELDSLATVLDGSEAAVFAYGLVAGRLAGAAAQRAVSLMAVHRSERDRLRTRMETLGGTPGAAAAAYEQPFPVVDSASARRLAALVEDRLAGQWAGLAAASAGQARASAALRAQEALVRSVTWSGRAPVWAGADGGASAQPATTS